mmetsp:Transcript_17825/g.39256  ORF Transcript_17825/g.39256 Transcript_17825/m.39256 type:complete len:416 (+) Transcript_17825:130-1377(+)
MEIQADIVRQLLACLGVKALKVQVGAGADARHGKDMQRPAQIARVEPGQRQSHAVASQRRPRLGEGAAILVLRHGCRRVHVGPDVVRDSPRNPARHIIYAYRDLTRIRTDGDADGALPDGHRVLTADLHGRSCAVLQQLNHDVEEVLWHIRKPYPLIALAHPCCVALHQDRHVLIYRVMLPAYLLRVLRCLLADHGRVASIVHDACAALACRTLRPAPATSHVLRGEHLCTDAREQEGVQPLPNLGLGVAIGLLEFAHRGGQIRYHAAHPALQPIDHVGEGVEVVDLKLNQPQLAEGLRVQAMHLHELRGLAPVRQGLDLQNPLSEADGQLRMREMRSQLGCRGIQHLAQGDGLGLLACKKVHLCLEELLETLLRDLHSPLVAGGAGTGVTSRPELRPHNRRPEGESSEGVAPPC